MNAVKRIKDGKVQLRQRFIGRLSRLDKATVPVGPYIGFFHLHWVEGIGQKLGFAYDDAVLVECRRNSVNI